MFPTTSFKSFVRTKAQPITRLFSTTAANKARSYKSVVNRQLKQELDLKAGDKKPRLLIVPEQKSKYPDYPYGEARIFKRSDRGLFGGQVISYGNQISEMKNKSRRIWLPNIVNKKLWSETLNKLIQVRLTTRVLKTITKEGGLDNYLTKDKAARVKELGIFGWRLRYDVLMTKERQNAPKNYQILTDASGRQCKVYHTGLYKGEEIKLVVGRRKLLQKLFPVVKYNTPGDLKFAHFNERRRATPFNELLQELEQYNVDLNDALLK